MLVSCGAACALTLAISPSPNPKQKPTMGLEVIAGMHSLPGGGFGFSFGGDQFPIRIARRHIARESPYVGDVRDLLGIAIDDVAVLVARHRYQLGLEAYGYLGVTAAHFGGGDLGAVA